jgi:hypothetical protein
MKFDIHSPKKLFKIVETSVPKIHLRTITHQPQNPKIKSMVEHLDKDTVELTKFKIQNSFSSEPTIEEKAMEAWVDEQRSKTTGIGTHRPESRTLKKFEIVNTTLKQNPTNT